MVTAADLDGIELTWGNVPGMMALMEKIARREGVGKVLAEGIVRAAPHFGPEAEKYVSHSKGMVMAGIAPRMIKGSALGSTRASSAGILFTSLTGCIVSVLIILFGQDSLTAIWIGTLGLGLSMAATFPTTLTYVEQHIEITGQITSFFFVGSSLAGMTLPWLIGQLFGAKGPQWTIYVILIALVIAMGVFILMNSHQPRPRIRLESKT